jgi:glycosyltransferase involved in cell wall biosynthesis
MDTLHRLGWRQDGPSVIGYVGRFVSQKGLQFLCSVLDELEAPWRAIFVGGGPLLPFLRQWAGRHGDRVRIATGVSHTQVPAYMSAIDVLALPSQTVSHWREQFGRVIIEAFACGVPLVASDSGEIPYVVADAGIICGERDRGAWLTGLGALAGDAARRRDYSARALERARHFAWPAVARRYLDFFNDLLENPTSDR